MQFGCVKRLKFIGCISVPFSTIIGCARRPQLYSFHRLLLKLSERERKIEKFIVLKKIFSVEIEKKSNKKKD